MTVLNVVESENEKLTISWPKGHDKSDKIEKWLKYLSPGYVEWLLKNIGEPHCENCRDFECENIGNGDDACRAFKFGETW